VKTYTVLHLFCGLGGAELGFAAARPRYLDAAARFRCVAGVDNDPAACADFEALTGATAVQADLATMTPDELRAAAGDEAPDVVFLSPPCKGFSGLLSRASSEGEKYQALNRLVLQGIALVLETWPRRPPRLLLLENVPRIQTRGAQLLHQVRVMLSAAGYRLHEGGHDCGELGGLGQHRRRFLLIARHAPQVPAFVYHPPKLRVRSIGEVLEAIPLPDAPEAGELHRLPRLQWRTWVRLALIPAGGDWRDLPEEGRYAVVADPEDVARFKGRPGLMGVAPWGEPTGAVTGSASPSGSNGTAAVADPRVPFNNVLRVARWDETAGAVTSGGTPTASGTCVADPRLDHAPRPGAYRVVRWDQAAPTVTGGEGVGRSCVFGVADARLDCRPRNTVLGVLPWDQPAGTVIGSADVHAGAAAVADPRIPADTDCPDPPPVIVAEDGTWHRPLTPLELAALQGLPMRMPDGRPLTLAGRRKGAWLERIGNAVPVGAAQAIAETIGRSLLAVDAGMSFILGGEGVWVEERAEEMSA
jgi:site-specific DNA-cytosine methylase